MLAHMIHSGDRHAVYAICIAVEIALIATARTVPTRKHEDAALAVSAVLNPI